MVADRFREPDLRDVMGNASFEPRVTRWSDASFDIRALRKHVKDGPYSVAEDSRALLITSLASARVENDSSGNTRLIKKGTNNTGRDDIAAALTLAAGAFARYPAVTADSEERHAVVVG